MSIKCEFFLTDLNWNNTQWCSFVLDQIRSIAGRKKKKNSYNFFKKPNQLYNFAFAVFFCFFLESFDDYFFKIQNNLYFVIFREKFLLKLLRAKPPSRWTLAGINWLFFLIFQTSWICCMEQMLFRKEKRFYCVNIDFKKCSEALIYTFVNIRNSVLDIQPIVKYFQRPKKVAWENGFQKA